MAAARLLSVYSRAPAIFINSFHKSQAGNTPERAANLPPSRRFTARIAFFAFDKLQYKTALAIAIWGLLTSAHCLAEVNIFASPLGPGPYLGESACEPRVPGRGPGGSPGRGNWRISAAGPAALVVAAPCGSARRGRRYLPTGAAEPPPNLRSNKKRAAIKVTKYCHRRLFTAAS